MRDSTMEGCNFKDNISHWRDYWSFTWSKMQHCLICPDKISLFIFLHSQVSFIIPSQGLVLLMGSRWERIFPFSFSVILPNFQRKVKKKKATQPPTRKCKNMLHAVIKVSTPFTIVCFQILFGLCWCCSYSALRCYVLMEADCNNWELVLHPEHIIKVN